MGERGSQPEGLGDNQEIEELLKISVFGSLGTADRQCMRLLSEVNPPIAQKIREITEMTDPDKQRKAYHDFMILVGQLQERIIGRFLSTTRGFTEKEKDFLSRNYRSRPFWELLVILALSGLGERKSDDPKAALVWRTIKNLIKKGAKLPEFTIRPGLDNEAFGRFQTLLLSAIARLSADKSLDRALTQWYSEADLIEIRQLAERLPKVELDRLLAKMYRDRDFAQYRLGITRLQRFLFPPDIKGKK
jgi:hypothetical protein